MRTKHVPFFGIVLAAMVAAVTIVPGAMTATRGAADELEASGDSGALTIDEVHGEAVTEITDANCRYGAAINNNTDHYKWIDDLHAGWWINFQVNYDPNKAPTNDAEYAHAIWVKQLKDGSGNYLNDYDVVPSIDDNSLGYLILNRPGALWIIGNEVDRGPNPPPGNEPGQGDTMPQMYARIYHDLYNYIKSWDPTALVTPSALVEFTPGRQQYLDIVWNTYKQLYGAPMPADLWNMHLYILPEVTAAGAPNDAASVALGTNPALGMREFSGDLATCNDHTDNVYCKAEHDSIDIFIDQVTRMRTWMKNHGYQNYPLIITEYSLLYPYDATGGCNANEQDEKGSCFDPTRVNNYAQATFNYLESATSASLGYPLDNNRLVQQWMWYSIYQTNTFSVSNLANSGNVNNPLSLTLAGQSFQAKAAVEKTVNLVAVETNHPVATAKEGMVSARLSVEMRNNGNTRVNEPIEVTFYRNQALTQVIGTTTVPAPSDDFLGMTGCAVRGLHVTANASWAEDLEPGEYPFWAKVDSNGSVGEEDENDNVASGFFEVFASGTYIPMAVK